MIESLAKDQKEEEEDKAQNVLRLYDLSICYDRYYYCPRMFLKARTEEGTPVTSEQIQEDVDSTYANKVVTNDVPHYGTGEAQISIHPCKHSAVLKDRVNQIREEKGENAVGPHVAILLFLGFFSGVMPGIQIDVNFFSEVQ